MSGGDGFQDQHRSFAKAGQKPVKNGLEGPIKVNQRESPLARYAARKDKSGRPLLEPEQVRAGERLREDYTFAQLTPSLSRGWQTERISGSGPQAGSADMTTDVIAARARVQRILSSMEPVLASVAVDVCCHLKGLEVVEAERDWPSRSARLLLQVALSSLATRYGERVQGPPGKG
nr:DUF6456 domain-containing protein [Roseibium denhamense]